MSNYTQPPVLSQHWQVMDRQDLVIQRRRSGLAGPVLVVPNPQWVNKLEQTGFCSGDQIPAIKLYENDATHTVLALDGMLTGKWGECWMVSAKVETTPTASYVAGQWITSLHFYRIVWQQVTYAAPTFP